MRARALFAKHPFETVPVLVAAIDETIWEHEDEETGSLEAARNGWPSEYEWAEAWVDFDDDLGLRLFSPTPVVTVNVEPASTTDDPQGSSPGSGVDGV